MSAFWGSGASFQAVVTSMVHELYCLHMLIMVRQKEIRQADFIAGVSIMMNLLLLQTGILWGDFAGGFFRLY